MTEGCQSSQKFTIISAKNKVNLIILYFHDIVPFIAQFFALFFNRLSIYHQFYYEIIKFILKLWFHLLMLIIYFNLAILLLEINTFPHIYISIIWLHTNIYYNWLRLRHLDYGGIMYKILYVCMYIFNQITSWTSRNRYTARVSTMNGIY